MPFYAFSCETCGAVRDLYRSVAERNDPVTCECGASMHRTIIGHNVIGDLEPYYDENLDTHIKSRQHRKEVMREQGVYEKFGKGWR